MATSLAVFSLPSQAAPQSPAECARYAYAAAITRVIDGDTVVADIDLGFHTWRRGERIRLSGIDALEVRGEEREAGLVAKAALAERIEGNRVIICTEEDEQGKNGRDLSWIFEARSPSETRDTVNVWMVRQEFASEYEPESLGTDLARFKADMERIQSDGQRRHRSTRRLQI